jgi:hypothetical protein
MRGKLRIGTLILSVDIEQDLKGSMEKTLGNVEVDPDKFAILMSPETQKLLAMARYLWAYHRAELYPRLRPQDVETIFVNLTPGLSALLQETP